jgi:regulator of CtrA degradation
MNASHPRIAEQPATIFLMPNLFKETLDMLVEARDYFEGEGAITADSLHGIHKIHYALEMSRVTLRLTCVMAWLSAQKAVCAGEISRLQAQERYALDEDSICLTADLRAEQALPPTMRRLLTRSLSLYERVFRLNQQLEREIDATRE